jgi:hypothetical protein
MKTIHHEAVIEHEGDTFHFFFNQLVQVRRGSGEGLHWSVWMAHPPEYESSVHIHDGEKYIGLCVLKGMGGEILFFPKESSGHIESPVEYVELYHDAIRWLGKHSDLIYDMNHTFPEHPCTESSDSE